MNSAAATTKKSPCGCGGARNATTSAKATCGCTTDPPNKTCLGTEEATRRPGVVIDARQKPRPRFFRGQLVSDVELSATVDYARCHDRLDNRVIGGWGVYCGYGIEVDSSCCCIRVGPGVAYDALGRSLVNNTSVCLPRPQIGETGLKDPCDRNGPPVDRTLWLAVAYDDCLDAARPRYTTPCGDSSDPGCDFSQVRERARFVWLEEEPPEEYWITGCLSDPCARPPEEEEDGCGEDFREPREPQLDRCTPKTGVRGGVGVARYAQALLERWNLPRNAQVLGGKLNGEGYCEGGVGALLDIIAGVACAPCGGEALVLLAKVDFTSSECGTEQIEVVPLRRRVLSNADLTYLVWWMIREQICQPTRYPVELEPPLETAVPCEDDREHEVESAVRAIADRIAGEGADAKLVESVRSRLLYQRYLERVPLRRLGELENQLEVRRYVLGRTLEDQEVEALTARNAAALGRGERRRYVEAATLDLYGAELSGKERAAAERIIDQAFAEDAVLDLKKLPLERRRATLEKLKAQVRTAVRPERDELLAAPHADELSAERLAEAEALLSTIPELAKAWEEKKAAKKGKGKKPKLEVPPKADDDGEK